MQSTMRITIAPNRTIELVQGDITREKTDAVVNAANSELLPGGGVCGAIHRAGGPEIADECIMVRARKGPVPPGGAAATTGGRLSAKYVIHAVGPVWHGGDSGEAETLASAYREALRVADELGLQSVAFPAISTGIFGYPLELAAEIALSTASRTLPGLRNVSLVRFVLFDAAALNAFQRAAQATVIKK